MTSSGDWRRAATTEQMSALTRTIDPAVAHIARIQDYWLGGKDHSEADRIAGDEAIAQLPDTVASVRNTRAFLGRTVRFLAAEQGIRQFLDLGTGIPAASSTHEVAQEIAPASRIVYVDNDQSTLGCSHGWAVRARGWRAGRGSRGAVGGRGVPVARGGGFGGGVASWL